MSFWLKMSRLGIKDDMPFYLQKSIILYNQIIRLLMIFFTGAIFFLYFMWNITIVPIFFIAILIVLGFTLLLNYKGKVGLSILIVSLMDMWISLEEKKEVNSSQNVLRNFC